MASLAWSGQTGSGSHCRNRRYGARCSRRQVSDCCRRAQGGAPPGRSRDLCVRTVQNIMIDFATTRRREEAISTAIAESTVQWLLHRRMNAQQQMRWSPRGAHLMLKVRCAVMNGTLEQDYAVAEHWARRPFRSAA